MYTLFCKFFYVLHMNHHKLTLSIFQLHVKTLCVHFFFWDKETLCVHRRLKASRRKKVNKLKESKRRKIEKRKEANEGQPQSSFRAMKGPKD